MTKMLFYDTKSYDKTNFDLLKRSFAVDITYVGVELNEQTAAMAKGYEVVCAFVNATINRDVVDQLVAGGTKLLAMRCAGYNNVDIKETCGKLRVVRVPAYSPYAVAEHAMALLLTLVRKNEPCVRKNEGIQFLPCRLGWIRSPRENHRGNRYGENRERIHRHLQRIRHARARLRRLPQNGDQGRIRYPR